MLQHKNHNTRRKCALVIKPVFSATLEMLSLVFSIMFCAALMRTPCLLYTSGSALAAGVERLVNKSHNLGVGFQNQLVDSTGFLGVFLAGLGANHAALDVYKRQTVCPAGTLFYAQRGATEQKKRGKT